MSQKYEKLKILLKELFQLDQPDLDFGLYRVMHAKSAEVSQFLDNDLLPQVQAAFGQYRTADKAELEKELSTVIAGVETAGMNPDDSPKVKDLRARLKSDAVDIGALESEVYDHLFSFFRRYYVEGDFLARRVYKPGVYAIPYEGEEVTLHWANKNQYYIKTSEYLRDYAFRLRPDDENKPMRVHFRLADAAEGEHGNVKAAEGKDRVFILAAPGESGHDFIAEEDGEQGKELVIRFEYRPAALTDWPEEDRDGKKKPPTQKDLSALATKRILAATDPELAEWIAELGKLHIMASGEQADYTRLEAHLRRYTARNTFDYFIHKDLGAFLRRELDFYIKNEVMHLDDVENESAPRVEQYLSKIKVIRKIARKIIEFLAQLEDFQKKLWLKKKFVVETQYCIAVGNIPEEFYTEIAANEVQHEEWVQLLAIDEMEGDLTTPRYSKKLKPEFLEAHPTLMVDTRHFAVEFAARLLEAIGDVDEQTDGVLFHSENFQALAAMQVQYRGKLRSIYIDPPYNVPGSEIAYKNAFLHSSWISLIDGRITSALELLSSDGILCITIDDYEKHRLMSFLEATGECEILGVVCIRNNPSGRSTVKGFAVNHEYAVFASTKSNNCELGRLHHSDDQRARYDLVDDGRSYELENMRKSSAGSLRPDRPKQHYALFVERDSLKVRLPSQVWDDGNKSYEILESPPLGVEVVYPVGRDGIERVWSIGIDRASQEIDFLVADNTSGQIEIYKRKYLNPEGILPRTWWDKTDYSARDNGTRLLRDLLGRNQPFDFPKAPAAVEDCLRVSGLQKDDITLDFSLAPAPPATP